MSDVEQPEYKQGNYGLLSPQIFEEARILDEAFDMRASAKKLEESVGEIKTELQAEFEADVEALMATEDLSHDDFLLTYQTIISKLDRHTDPVREFNRLMEARAKLAPGVFIVLPANRGKMIEVAEVEEESESEVIQPVLVASNDGRNVEFKWKLTTVDDETVLINEHAIIGKEAILAHLYKEFFPSYRIKDQPLFTEPRGIAQYRRLGEEEKANRLHEDTLKKVKELFTGLLNDTNARLDYNLNLSKCIQLFDRLDSTEYSTFVDNVCKNAALGVNRAFVLTFIDAYADYEAQVLATIDKEQTYTRPTPVEIADTYSYFVQRGNDLMNREAIDKYLRDEDEAARS